MKDPYYIEKFARKIVEELDYLNNTNLVESIVNLIIHLIGETKFRIDTRVDFDDKEHQKFNDLLYENINPNCWEFIS